MSSRKFNLPLNQQNLQFSSSDIPKDIDDNTRIYLQELIKTSNNELKDFRVFLLENSSCENCFCWFCAFTIIGTIPFCIWSYKKKSDKIEVNSKIRSNLDFILKYVNKQLTDSMCVILLKLTKVNNINDNINMNWYYEIELKKPIIIKFDKPNIDLTIFHEKTTMKLASKAIPQSAIIDNLDTKRKEEQGIQNGNYNPYDAHDYQKGSYQPLNIGVYPQPIIHPNGNINMNTNQYENNYQNQGNYMMNNQTCPNTINTYHQPNILLNCNINMNINQGMNANNQNAYQEFNNGQLPPYQ